MAVTRHEMGQNPEDDEENDSMSTYDHAIYAAPWRDRLPSGELGGEFGPISNVTGESVSPERAIDEYRSSSSSVPVRNEGAHGGLWDYDCLSRSETRRRKAAEGRADAAAVARYVESHSASMPKRLLEVAILYWEHRYQRGRVAQALGVKPASVWDYIKQIRRLVRGRHRLTLAPPGVKT